MRGATLLVGLLAVLLSGCGDPEAAPTSIVGTWVADRDLLAKQAARRFEQELAVAKPSDKAQLEATRDKRLEAIQRDPYRLTIEADGTYRGEGVRADTGAPITTEGRWEEERDKWILTPASPDQGPRVTLRLEGARLVGAQAGDGLVVQFLRE